MKVWIVSIGDPLPTDGDNIRLRRIGNIAQCFANTGHQVEWFTVSFDHYKKVQRCNRDKDIIINDNFVIHLLYTKGYKKNISISRIIHHKIAEKKIYKKMNQLSEPDIIIATMEPLEISKIATIYGEKKSIPVIIDIQDLWPEIYYEVINKRLHFLLFFYVSLCRKKLRESMSKAYSIIALSNDFLEYGIGFSGRKKCKFDKVFPMAYPNYNYEEYKNKFDEYWGKYNLKKDDFIIVFFGNFGNQFDFTSIIEASKILIKNKKIKFVLCGTGAQLKNIQKNVLSNVIFPGWIEQEEISSLAINSNLGIAPYINSINYTKNAPNKFGEYLSAGLPILVSVGGVMEDMLNKKECGYRYKNYSDLVNIINDYFENNKKLSIHSENARKLFEEKFNGDFEYKKIVNHCINIKKYIDKL